MFTNCSLYHMEKMQIFTETKMEAMRGTCAPSTNRGVSISTLSIKQKNGLRKVRTLVRCAIVCHNVQCE